MTRVLDHKASCGTGEFFLAGEGRGNWKHPRTFSVTYGWWSRNCFVLKFHPCQPPSVWTIPLFCPEGQSFSIRSFCKIHDGFTGMDAGLKMRSTYVYIYISSIDQTSICWCGFTVVTDDKPYHHERMNRYSFYRLEMQHGMESWTWALRFCWPYMRKRAPSRVSLSLLKSDECSFAAVSCENTNFPSFEINAMILSKMMSRRFYRVFNYISFHPWINVKCSCNNTIYCIWTSSNFLC